MRYMIRAITPNSTFGIQTAAAGGKPTLIAATVVTFIVKM